MEQTEQSQKGGGRAHAWEDLVCVGITVDMDNRVVRAWDRTGAWLEGVSGERGHVILPTMKMNLK